MTVIQFSSQYILLLLYCIGVTVNCVTVIGFSSQYILLLLYCTGVTVNSVTIIYFGCQYILLLLFLTLSGTELHGLCPPCCFQQLTKGDIWDMFIIDKVWCITLTIPLPPALKNAG